MSTLPQGNPVLSNGVIFEDQPTNTFYIDPVSKRVRGMDSGKNAMRQAIEIALSVERFKWGIYSANFGVDFSGIIGYETGYAAAVLEQRIKDALSIDNRVLGVTDFTYSASGGKLTANVIIQTVYGDIAQIIEVMTN